MAQIAYVYALLDADGRPRYVGNSTNPRRRVNEHWSNKHRDDRAKSNPELSAWLRSLDAHPESRIIASVDYAERFGWERFYTERLRGQGFDLLNIRTGAGGFTPTAATREKMSAAHRGMKPSPETIAKRVATRMANRRAALCALTS